MWKTRQGIYTMTLSKIKGCSAFCLGKKFNGFNFITATTSVRKIKGNP